MENDWPSYNFPPGLTTAPNEVVWNGQVIVPVGQGRQAAKETIRAQFQKAGDRIWAKLEEVDPTLASDGNETRSARVGRSPAF